MCECVCECVCVSVCVCVCVCLMYLSVGCLVVNCLLLFVGAARVHITGSQPNIPQTSTSGTHTHRQHYSHIPNKQLDEANKQGR